MCPALPVRQQSSADRPTAALLADWQGRLTLGAAALRTVRGAAAGEKTHRGAAGEVCLASERMPGAIRGAAGGWWGVRRGLRRGSGRWRGYCWGRRESVGRSPVAGVGAVALARLLHVDEVEQGGDCGDEKE